MCKKTYENAPYTQVKVWMFGVALKISGKSLSFVKRLKGKRRGKTSQRVFWAFDLRRNHFNYHFTLFSRYYIIFRDILKLRSVVVEQFNNYIGFRYFLNW